MRDGRPDTLFAWNDGAALAYQVIGTGSEDLVYRQGWLSNVELNWDHPIMARFLRSLAVRRRLIVMDARGSGCSDRGSPRDVPPLELQMEDLVAVLDAAGSRRAVLIGTNDQAFVACMAAAAYPERTAALILYEVSANFTWTEETPWEWTDEQWDAQEARFFTWAARTAEQARHDVQTDFPSVAGDASYIDWWRRYGLLSGGIGAGLAQARLYRWTDIRDILPTIRVPTLVLAQPGHPEPSWSPAAQFVARRIPGARLVDLPGGDAGLWLNAEPAVRAIDAFLAEVQHEEAELERVLATVLFTDIVESTGHASRLGDHAWADLVRSHHATVRSLLARFRGTEVDTAGDGFFATFDGPGRAVRCAEAIVDAVTGLGIEVRAGLHTGEVETLDGKVGGLAVSIGARVGSLASPSSILVTSTVKDLCAGSDLRFEDAGEHELKGVPERWRLFSVAS
jgi:class 3 adenylate cyclase